MKDETHKAHTAGLIRGESVHQYLNSYATEFDLHKNLRLNSKVLSASRQDRQWRISLQNNAEHLTSDKLIIATGLTSEPFVPEINNKSFRGSVIHSKELGKREVYERVSSESIQSVAVYGASKSSFDAVNLLLRAGKHVHWIVRPGKGGPSIMTPLRILGRPSFYLNNSRLLAMFSPNIFSNEATTRWLHQTGPACITQPIVRGFWKLITFLLMGEAQYGKSENGKLLKPVMGLDSLLWSPATLGVMTHPDLWKDIHEGTKVHVQESSIKTLNDKHVELENGNKVEADMVVFCTGWKSLAKNYIFSEDDCLKAGLPSPKSFDAKTKQKWLGLRQQSDARVTGLMPLLSDSPGWKDHHPRLEDDFHLYQSIVPATANEEDDRSLAYIGFLRTTGAPIVYEAQALWAAAYLQGKLEVPSKEERERRTAELNAWVRRRYLCGRKVPFAMFDFLPVSDMNDLASYVRGEQMLTQCDSTLTCFTAILGSIRTAKAILFRKSLAFIRQVTSREWLTSG